MISKHYEEKLLHTHLGHPNHVILLCIFHILRVVGGLVGKNTTIQDPSTLGMKEVLTRKLV